MGSVSSLGVGSGIDLQSLVDGLVTAEATRRLAPLDVREGSATARISAYGVLRSSLSEFQTAVSSLANISNFQERSVTVSDTEAFSVSAGLNSPLGSVDVEVLQLGQAQRIAGTGFVDITGTAISSADTNIGGGSLTIQLSGQAAFTVDIAPASSSLNEIALAINDAEENTGVSASVVAADTGPVLVLNSNNSGTANTITLTTTDIDGDAVNDQGLSQLSYDPLNSAPTRLVETQVATDAIISVSGQSVTSTSGNTFDEVITGVSITAQQVTTGIENFRIEKNFSAANSAIEEFITAYNALDQSVDELGSAGVDGVGGGSLVGDSVLRSVQSQLRQTIFTRFTETQPVGVQSLSDIGVSFDRDGQLELDGASFSALLESNFNDVVALLTNTGDSVAQPQGFQSIAYAGLTSQPGDITVAISAEEESFSVDLNGLDLVAARDAINNAADNFGVTATVILEDDGASGIQARLLISGDTNGVGFTIDATNNGGGEVSLFTQTQASQVTTSEGVLARIEDVIDTFLVGNDINASSGIIGARTDGLNDEIERIEDERLIQQRRLEDLEARLVAQYSALDLLVSNLQSNGSFLLDQLNSLSQINNNSGS